MATNPDPKPGRWVLPLVVLGMVAFTYFFVRALPEGANGGPTDSLPGPTDTSVPGDTTDVTGGGPGTTAPNAEIDPATQAYLEGVAGVQSSLEELQREMAAVNGGFDADPRTVPYQEAVARLEVLADSAGGLVEDIDALTPPEALTTNHDAIRTAVTTAAAAADEALAGLQSTDDGTQRRNAIAAFDQAVTDLQTAVDNARSAAGLSAPTTAPPDTTTPPETTSPPTTEGG